MTALRARWRAWGAGYNRVRPTAAGGWFVATMLGVTMAALNTGNNFLYLVLSAQLGLLVVNNLLAEWNLRGLQVGRALPAELFAGVPAAGGLVLRNRRKLGRAFAVEVEERDGGRARALFDSVGPLAEAEVPATWTFEGRGVQQFAVVRIGSAYPFGLLRRWRDLDVPGEVLVYPGVERDPPAMAPDGQGVGGATRGGVDDTGEMQGIRAYQPGDPIRRIHWGISARVGEPVVVIRAGERGAEVLVVVETGTAGREAAIRRATGRVVWHAQRGDAVGLLADGEKIDVSSGAAHRRRLLTRLALLPGERS